MNLNIFFAKTKHHRRQLIEMGQENLQVTYGTQFFYMQDLVECVYINLMLNVVSYKIWIWQNSILFFCSFAMFCSNEIILFIHCSFIIAVVNFSFWNYGTLFYFQEISSKNWYCYFIDICPLIYFANFSKTVFTSATFRCITFKSHQSSYNSVFKRGMKT